MNVYAEHSADSMHPDGTAFRGWPALMWGGLLVGLLGLVLMAIGFTVDTKQASFSYLIAYFYVFSIAVGAMAFVMAVNAMGATWPTTIRRIPEAIMAIFPLLLVLFVPIALVADYLYPWMHPELITDYEARHLLEHKLGYLNLPLALLRLAIFFAFWIIMSHLLRKWSLVMNRPGQHERTLYRMKATSSVALFFFGIFTTMAVWDWVMSLSPDWFSTMFGIYFLAGGFLGAISTILLLALAARRAGYLHGFGVSHGYALGRLLFAFLIFWAYTGYFQYMLTWIANRPIEAKWFLLRTTNLYKPMAYFLVLGHFALPFLILLSYKIKQKTWGLALLSGWLLFAHYFDVHWIIAAARESALPFSWQDPAALMLVLGLTVAFGTWRQRGLPMAAVYDPKFAAALEYHSK